MGRLLIGAGLVLIGVGVVVLLAGKANIPLGRLPGDFTWQGRGWMVSFPLVTCLVLSVVLSVVMWVVNHLRR